jgi:hypothetical protein
MKPITEKNLLDFVATLSSEEHNSINSVDTADHLAGDNFDYNCNKLHKRGARAVKIVDATGTPIDAYGQVTWANGTVNTFPVLFSVLNSFADTKLNIISSDVATTWAKNGSCRSGSSFKFVKSAIERDAEQADLATTLFNWMTANHATPLDVTLIPDLYNAYKTLGGGELFTNNDNILIDSKSTAEVGGWSRTVTDLPGGRQNITYSFPLTK